MSGIEAVPDILSGRPEIIFGRTENLTTNGYNNICITTHDKTVQRLQN